MTLKGYTMHDFWRGHFIIWIWKPDKRRLTTFSLVIGLSEAIGKVVLFVAESMTTFFLYVSCSWTTKTVADFWHHMKIWGSCSSVAEESSLLGCDIVSVGASFFRNIRMNSTIDIMAYLKRLESFLHQLGESLPTNIFLHCFVDTASRLQSTVTMYFQKTSLSQMLYLSDNLAYFPYQVQDEPLFIIHHIDIMISVSGTNLLQSFREVSIS